MANRWKIGGKPVENQRKTALVKIMQIDFEVFVAATVVGFGDVGGCVDDEVLGVSVGAEVGSSDTLPTRSHSPPHAPNP